MHRCRDEEQLVVLLSVGDDHGRAAPGNPICAGLLNHVGITNTSSLNKFANVSKFAKSLLLLDTLFA